MIGVSSVTSNHHFLYTVFAAEEDFHKYTTINPTGRLNVGNVDMDLFKFKVSLSGNFKFIFSVLCFDNVMLMTWLGLSIKTSWLGLEKIMLWFEKKLFLFLLIRLENISTCCQKYRVVSYLQMLKCISNIALTS